MRRIHLAVLAVFVVAVLVVAGAMLVGASDPFPKKAILKAQDMESITNLHGNWTQDTLNMSKNPSSPYGSKQAALSIVVFENDSTSFSFVFMVAEMNSTEQAEKQCYEAISPWQNDDWTQTSLDSIGDGGVMITFNPPTTPWPFNTYFIFFHKGIYLVEIAGSLDAAGMLKLAEAQADRLP